MTRRKEEGINYYWRKRRLLETRSERRVLVIWRKWGEGGGTADWEKAGILVIWRKARYC